MDTRISVRGRDPSVPEYLGSRVLRKSFPVMQHAHPARVYPLSDADENPRHGFETIMIEV